MKEIELRKILNELDKTPPLNYEFFLILNTEKKKPSIKEKFRGSIKSVLPRGMVRVIRQSKAFNRIKKFI